NVVAFADHDSPPIIFHVPLQLHAEWSIIPAAVQAAVDFARLENESAPLAQADDLFHPARTGTRRRRAVRIRVHSCSTDYDAGKQENRNELFFPSCVPAFLINSFRRRGTISRP